MMMPKTKTIFFRLIIAAIILCTALPAHSQDINRQIEEFKKRLSQKEKNLLFTGKENIPKVSKSKKLSGGIAELRGLNKITARISSFAVESGLKAHFGNLEIKLHDCWKAPPEEQPEAKALLEIWEQRKNEEGERIFYGWMFKSSPALNALEHPVYDIILLDCQM